MDRPWYQSFNWVMALATVTLSLCGVLVIHSADLHDLGASGEWRKQLIYIGLGVVVMTLFAAIDYHKWQRWALGLYVGNIALLGLVMVGGRSALGARRWINLGFIQFQPSEPAKVVLAICIAALLARKASVGRTEMLQTIGMVALPALLVLRQPDLGTSLVIGAILSAELFFGVSRLWYFGAYAAAAAALAAFVVGTSFVLKPFQRSRLLVFLHPEADLQGVGWNLNQSKIAVGSGELFGKGLYHGTQTQLNFVPEHSRDFIFTVVGEEFGYAGSIGLIIFYAIILFGAFRAVLAARDRFGVLLAVGLVAMLAFHITINIGMTVGIMPITGIPLPFVSYGGTAILTDYAAIGLLLNIDVQRDNLIF
ncbi:MAG: rod shape-determining protein RodA [Vulcanimicrobiaceae bacterium]